MRPIAALLAWVAVALGAPLGPAHGHDLGVVRASLEEMPGGRYVLKVETSPGFAEVLGPPELPQRCVHADQQDIPAVDAGGAGLVQPGTPVPVKVFAEPMMTISPAPSLTKP